MILNKIKQNLAGFTAVLIAATGFVAVSPANAAYTPTVTAEIESTGDVLLVSLSEPYYLPGASRVGTPFSVTVNGVSSAVNGIDTSWSSLSQVRIFLNSRVLQGATVTMSYNQASSGWLKNSNNEMLASFSGLAVTNNSAYVTLTNTASPTISGTAEVGQILTASSGTWTPANPTLTYSWYTCPSAMSAGTGAMPLLSCSRIMGATSSTYTLTSFQGAFRVLVAVEANYMFQNLIAFSATTTTVAAQQQQQQQQQPQNTTVTVTPTLSGAPTPGTTVTVSPTQFSGATATQKYWVSCSAAQSQAVVGLSNYGMQNASGPLVTLMGNCYPIYVSNSNPNPNFMTTATSFAIPSDGMVWQRINSVYSQVSLAGRYLGWIETQSSPTANGSGVTFAVAFGASAPSVVTPPPTAMPTEVPILKPIAGVSQGIRAGGTLVLETANGATITEVRVADQTATLSKVEKGVEILVPTGLTPGAKDLLIKTSTGSTLHVGAIKIADPVLEAQKLAMAKAAASVSFRAPLDLKVSGSNITSRQAAEIRAMVREYRAAKEVVCIAVPASKSNVASAREAASRTCSAFKAANRNLRVTVIVEAPSGAAANVISSELIG